MWMGNLSVFLNLVALSSWYAFGTWTDKSKEEIFSFGRWREHVMRKYIRFCLFFNPCCEADSIPIIMGGDFNVHSHLDWTETTRNLYLHWWCSGGLACFIAMEEAGFKDISVRWTPTGEGPIWGNVFDRCGFVWKLSVVWTALFYWLSGKNHSGDSIWGVMTIVWVKLLLLKEKIFLSFRSWFVLSEIPNLIKIRVDKIDIHEKDLFIIVPDVVQCRWWLLTRNHAVYVDKTRMAYLTKVKTAGGHQKYPMAWMGWNGCRR